ncbi:MAG: ABC transporter substrate-binding protein, partial [Phycicoccus sp.]
MTTRTTRWAGAATALVLTASALSACGDSDSGSDSGGDSGSGGEAKKIALLLPENKTARYEAFDKPFFEAGVKAG